MSRTHRRQAALLCLILGSSPLCSFAQTGDRLGEVQVPPPSHLKSPPAPALAAADELRTFKLPAGFRMELVAAEPLVFDPVAMAIGADGRLWVAEMRAYMQNVDGTGESAPIGTIAVLDDIDGDGRMDQRTEFAGGLVLPRALALVAGGVLVAEPPNLWFMEDIDGDDVADRRTLIANDYGNRSNPEHTANGLLRGLDNWLYSANHTVRFRFERGTWRREPTLFRGQWGIAQDDAGRLFYNTNSDPLRMDVLPAEYLRRNAHLRTPDSVNVQLVKPEALPVWPGRITLGVNRGYRLLRDDGTLPSVTAACAPLVYRGTSFPREFRGNAFFAEPSANLVKRVLIEEVAGRPRARNAYAQREFLTSTDERFRPVNLNNGPNGELYVVDMYRGVIQHRIYLTSYLRDQIKQRGLEAPVGLGRIWRVVPTRMGKRVRPALDVASTATLVTALAQSQAWWRDTAQQLLVERQDPAAIPQLRALLNHSRAAHARLHALWTLEGLHAVEWREVATGLLDANVDVAVAAARLSEAFFKGEAKRTATALAQRASRNEPAFLRQLALSLGAAPEAIAVPELVRLARLQGALPFAADAIVSSLAGHEPEAHRQLVASNDPRAAAVVASLTAAVLESGDAQAIEAALAPLGRENAAWLHDALLDGLDRFIPGDADKRRTAFLPAEPRALIAFAAGSAPAAKRAADTLRFLRWRGLSLDTRSPLASLSESERAQFERGAREFAICAACHQPNGEGMSGLAPSLVGSPWATGGYAALVRIVLNGKTSGETTMPPLNALDDETLAAVLTYIRRSWGHESSVITTGQVKAVRSEVALREEPWSEAELAPMN